MAARPRHLGITRTSVAAIMLLVGLTGGLAACGEGPGSEPDREGCGSGAACAVPPTAASTPSTAPVDIHLRPVQSTDPASSADQPCPTDLPVPAPTEIVVSPGCSDGVVNVVYRLGPSLLDGSAFESARAVESENTGGWVVNPVLKQGARGIDLFNAAAARCYAKDETCPSGQLAIVVDGVVISAPAIQQPHFEADQIQISGGPFTEASATALAAGIDAAG